MANEITYTGTLNYVSGQSRASMFVSGSATPAGIHHLQNVQTVGTAEEALVKGDIGTIGFCVFRNRDATNFVEIGPATTVYSIKLAPGEASGPIKWDGSTIFAKANTAPVELEYLLIEG